MSSPVTLRDILDRARTTSGRADIEDAAAFLVGVPQIAALDTVVMPPRRIAAPARMEARITEVDFETGVEQWVQLRIGNYVFRVHVEPPASPVTTLDLIQRQLREAGMMA